MLDEFLAQPQAYALGVGPVCSSARGGNAPSGQISGPVVA
jgi:hypothetical protein